MRQLLLISCLVALFVYIGFVLQTEAASVNAGNGPDYSQLERAFAATGGHLDHVVMTGWIRGGAREREAVAQGMGWSIHAGRPGETGELGLVFRHGMSMVTVRWVLTGKQASSWSDNAARLWQTLDSVGPQAQLTVQLEGRVGSGDPARLVSDTLRAVSARTERLWTGPNAASLAGTTSALPPGPYGVNIQSAVRGAANGGYRVWVAWPALSQEY